MFLGANVPRRESS